jgi:hypothetical protein
MTERKPFLLRLKPATMAALKSWAADDLRSVNGQIEFLLRAALRDAGRLPAGSGRDRDDDRDGADTEPDPSTPPAGRSNPRLRPRADRVAAGTGKVAR